MRYNSRFYHTQTSQGIRFLVGSLFCAFSFSYLWKVQGGMLAMAQHILSHGQTVYYSLVGALILTVVLMLLQWVFNLIVQLRNEWFAFSYFPSFLVLALLTSLDSSLYSGIKADYWWWLLPILVVAYIGLVIYIRRMQLLQTYRHPKSETGSYIANVATLLFCAIFTCFLGTTEKDLHNLVEIEYALSRNDFQQASVVGNYNQQAGKTTTAYRAFALARAGDLGEKLFAYPQQYGSDGLLVNRADSSHLLYHPDSIYWYLGAYPSAQTTTTLKYLRYLDLSERQRKPMAKDYLLAALLLEKKLPEFVEELTKLQPIADTLNYPRHYQEALVLYRHRFTSTLPYYNQEIEDCFEAYQQVLRKGVDEQAASNWTWEKFGKTYWWYYDYAIKKNE